MLKVKMWMEPWYDSSLAYKENDSLEYDSLGSEARKWKETQGKGIGNSVRLRISDASNVDKQAIRSLKRVFNWLNIGRPGFGLKATNATISSLLNIQALL